LFNITDNDANTNSSYVFTLPIDPKLFLELGKVSQVCVGQALSCEWQDPNTLEFLQSGCSVSKEMVDMGSGVVGTECTCSHLTVFALVLRSNMQLMPLCQAKEVDYVLIVLYGLLIVCLVIQPARGQYELSLSAVVQHLLIMLSCVLRIIYLVLKPVVASLPLLVLLGLLPSVVALSLFTYLLLTWARVQFSSAAKYSSTRNINSGGDSGGNSNSRVNYSSSGISHGGQGHGSYSASFRCFRAMFTLLVLLVMLVTIAIIIALGVSTAQSSSSPSISSTEVLVDGSYVLAGLYAAVCVLVLVLGTGLRKTLSAGVFAGHNWVGALRQRVLLAMVALSVCLFVAACLWVAAVQTDIVTSSALTLATSASFYAFDWLSLCLMTWLFVKAAEDSRRRPRSDESVDLSVTTNNNNNVS